MTLFHEYIQHDRIQCFLYETTSNSQEYINTVYILIIRNRRCEEIGKQGFLINQIALRMKKKMNTGTQKKDESGFNVLFML